MSTCQVRRCLRGLAMADQREGGIAWTDQTWNCIRGCSRVSEGCRHCYAEGVAARFSGPGQPYEGLALRKTSGPAWTGDVRFVPEHLGDPLKWKRPRRVFVNSMSDLFHEKVTDEQIAQVWAVMLLAPHHTFQVLTKRAERMREVLMDPDFYRLVLEAADDLRRERPGLTGIGISDPTHRPAKWIWLGVSAENQATANERVPLLLQTPAAVRFVSAEPLLSALDLRRYIGDEQRSGVPGSGRTGLVQDEPLEATNPRCDGDQSHRRQQGEPSSVEPRTGHALGEHEARDTRTGPAHEGSGGREERNGSPHGGAGDGSACVVGGQSALAASDCGAVGRDAIDHLGSGHGQELATLRLNWVIVGGESGSGARPCEIDWIRSIVRQCKQVDTACFVKQLGAKPRATLSEIQAWPQARRFWQSTEDGKHVVLPVDRKGGDRDEWPADLRVQQFPEPCRHG